MIKTKLREKRECRELSQSQLGYLARVPNCVISDCECGRRLPWPKARKALAEALNFPEADIFGSDDSH